MRKLIVLFAFLFSVLYCVAEIQLVTADIPFSFTAEGKTYPAGEYDFLQNDSATEVMIRGVKSNQSGMVPILTRLAPRPQGEAAIVFDQVGKGHMLSELHLPGMDGYLFKAAGTAKHTHVTIKGKKK
jgi:hypothetical protein